MNWSEFFAMGGYAAYVWPSFGLVIVSMVVMTLWAFRRRTLILRDIRRDRELNP